MARYVLAALAVVALATGAPITEIEESLPALNLQRIEAINHIATTWKAGYNERWAGMTLKDAKRQMGVVKSGNKLPYRTFTKEELEAVPSSFDARLQWGAKCPSVNEIRDQGACGSCWAFGASEAMTDRICIASYGKQQYHISAQDLVSCCSSCGDGCNGGDPGSAWDYFQNTGVVTGGNYGSNSGCLPYEIPMCNHHVNGTHGPCGNEVSTPACTNRCKDGESWNAAKHFGASSYSVPGDVASIQAEIYQNGPVEGAFTVYDDFLNYKSGVYVQTSQNELGGHAIKILGWGTENGIDYWLCANSWNNQWGDNGFFKIQRGVDMCGIEDDVVAGVPKI